VQPARTVAPELHPIGVTRTHPVVVDAVVHDREKAEHGAAHPSTFPVAILGPRVMVGTPPLSLRAHVVVTQPVTSASAADGRSPPPRGSHPALEARPATVPSTVADVRPWRTGGIDGVSAVARLVLGAALEAELTHHLGYAKHDPRGRRPGSNSRNGARPKTVLTWFGPVEVDVPRDRWGTFRPVTVGKWQRHSRGIDELVLPLAATGSQREEIVRLLTGAYRDLGTAALVNAISESIRERMLPWHRRPLPLRYAELIFSRIGVTSTRHGATWRPVHAVVGVADDGTRSLVGLWASTDRPTLDRWNEIALNLKARGLLDLDAVVCEADPGLARKLSSL